PGRGACHADLSGEAAPPQPALCLRGIGRRWEGSWRGEETAGNKPETVPSRAVARTPWSARGRRNGFGIPEFRNKAMAEPRKGLGSSSWGTRPCWGRLVGATSGILGLVVALTLPWWGRAQEPRPVSAGHPTTALPAPTTGHTPLPPPDDVDAPPV